MADSVTLTASLKSVPFSHVETLAAVSELNMIVFRLAAGAVDTAVPLTGLTAPKFLIVKGGEGVSVKINGETNAHPCDPLVVISNVTSGLTISALTASNSDVVEHELTVLAPE